MMSSVIFLSIVIVSRESLPPTTVPETGEPGVIGYLTSVDYLRWTVMGATVKDEAWKKKKLHIRRQPAS